MEVGGWQLCNIYESKFGYSISSTTVCFKFLNIYFWCLYVLLCSLGKISARLQNIYNFAGWGGEICLQLKKCNLRAQFAEIPPFSDVIAHQSCNKLFIICFTLIQTIYCRILFLILILFSFILFLEHLYKFQVMKLLHKRWCQLYLIPLRSFIHGRL